MNPNAISLAIEGLKSAYDSYSDYRGKKAAELYDTIQEAEKVVATQNEATKDAASTWVENIKEKVSDIREQFTEQADELTNKVKKRSKQAKKDAKLKGEETRCKIRYETKKIEEKTKKVRKNLEVRTRKTIDKATGKEEQRAKDSRIATASLVFAVVAAIIGVITWKLRKDDKLPVSPTPYQQKVEAFKTKVGGKTAEIRETVEEKAFKTKEKAEEIKDRTTDKADETKDKVAETKKTTEEKTAEASKQVQIKANGVKAERKNADDAKKVSSRSFKPAPKPSQTRKK